MENIFKESDNFIFKKPLEDYKSDLDPLMGYIKHAAFFLHKLKSIPLEDARKQVLEKIKPHIKDPNVTYTIKNDTGDLVATKSTLYKYLRTLFGTGDIVAPSFTKYTHPDKEESIHAIFLRDNTAKRKVNKKLAFTSKQLKDMAKYNYYNTLQKKMKVFNNSLSGAYSSKGTILFNPSGHYTLTSITRSVASIGNAITESIIGGNKHFRDPDIVINYITAVVCESNQKYIRYILDNYGIYKPNVNDVMKMIKFSSDNYWYNEDIENKLIEYLSKMDTYELAAILYTNDLWHFAMYNDEFTRNMIKLFSMRVNGGTSHNVEVLNNAPEGVANLAHLICCMDLKGKNVDYEAMADSDIVRDLASTTVNIVECMRKYSKIFKAFFTSEILPISISYIKDMLRDVIVLSDTDSTCGSYGKWVEWYFGESRTGSEAIAVSAVLMTLNTQFMDHNIKQLAKNMNIPFKNFDLLKMKNEFYWSSFVTTNCSKHYFASAMIQEGNVFTENDLELKGVQLISSKSNIEITKTIHGYIENITKELNNGNKIDIMKYVKYIADIERSIIERIKKSDIEIFKFDKIKGHKAYTKDQSESPYVHHLLWKHVFEESYGSPGEPIYMVITVPTILKTERETKDFINNIKSEVIRNKFQSFLSTSKRKVFGVFKIPLSLAVSKGIPVEIHPIIDTYRVINDNCSAGYLMLEALGFYKKPNRTLIDLGY